MRLTRALSLMLAACALLAACGVPGLAAAPDTPEGATAPKSKGSVTFAFDAFATYYPAIIVDVKGLLKKRGYDLVLAPFELDGQNSYSADEQWAHLKSGEFDVMAVTLNSFSVRADPAYGAITALIDESAGADKLVGKPEIASINDLRGKRIAFNQGSVSEYFLYYALNLAGLTPKDVTLLPKQTTDDAVKAYIDGEADALSAWEPNVLDAEAGGAREIIASDQLRAILDVLVSSRVSLENKPEALQAFHDAWFEALKLMTDTPDEAEQAIIDWGHTDWSYIAKPGDLRPALEHVAQATLGANQIAFRSPDLLISRLSLSQDVWEQAGQAPPRIDLSQVVDGRFVLGSARQPQLASIRPAVNSSFVLTARVELPQLSAQQLQAAQQVVRLPLERITFEPDSTRLAPRSADDIVNQVLPVLRTSRLYLKIMGSSAWPGPRGRFSQQEIEQVARDRAESLAQFLAGQGIDPNRLLIDTTAPKFPNSLDEKELEQDRFVHLALVAVGGR